MMRYAKFDPRKSYVGWLASEKKDGWQVRLMRSGRMRSRTGRREFEAPFSLLRTPYPLAAELLVRGRGAPAVASLLNPESRLWSRAELYAFDAPGPGPFRARTRRVKSAVRRACGGRRRCPLKYLRQQLIRSDRHLDALLERVLARGGEGLVLTHPDSRYVTGRSSMRVKLKPRQDAEGVVLRRRVEGGVLRSLRLGAHGRHSFRDFSLGTGFSSYQRHHPRMFPRGSVIKFSHRGLTQHGAPREARFLHIRRDDV